jgi:hypothetical protein
MFSLGLSDQIEALMQDPPPTSIDELTRPLRQRGKRLAPSPQP